jgi:UDP-N-acetylglucosamine 2-epimerase (non-hydrolysing)/GDP/UDP-N,N'-diacetylbacillosamine 2-epimerase (hydrolysing)
MSTPRTIAVFSSSRADYGHLYWPLRAMQAHPDLDPKLILFGAHFSPLFGHTADEVERDGFEVFERIECLLSSDSDVGMAKTIGLATLSLTDTLSRLRPDLMLLIADRYEMLSPASVALALRIPIAHIEGGEISEGAVDDAVRNALTKLSHLHFTPHQQAQDRVIGMGEEPWRVSVSGAPSLDHLQNRELISATELYNQLDLPTGKPLVVVAYHPVTLHRETTDECQAVFDALQQMIDQHDATLAFCFPNADAGAHDIIGRARNLCDQNANARLFVNLPHLIYWSLLSCADLMLGNSSSGIMETPSLCLPCVDIGDRQKGRLKAANIIHTSADRSAIITAINQALSMDFRKSIDGLINPYGDGHAGQHIANTLASTVMGDDLLIKRAL